MPVNAHSNTSQVELERLRTVQQGSSDWHHARSPRLTASDVSKVLGIDPYGDCQDLIKSKKQQWLQGPPAATAAQKRGIEEEPRVVEWFVSNALEGYSLASCESTGIWVMASSNTCSCMARSWPADRCLSTLRERPA
jgi:hypothetical protein